MKSVLASAVCGFIFGCGLIVSGMMQPAKVLGFLDLFGTWDPSLAFTMIGALAVSALGYAVTQRQGQPLLAPAALWPTKTSIDRPLVVGALMFGVGWGLSGLCPGPAIENLASLSPKLFVFMAAMIVGMLAQAYWPIKREAVRAPSSPDTAAVNADG